MIPKILAVLTRHPRQLVRTGVDFNWSSKSWTHNVFRLYEVICGRREGLRLQMSATASKGKVYYRCHSIEAVFALAEQYIREYLSSWKFVPFKVSIPVLWTPQGFPVFASPYLFALVLENHTLKLPAATAQSFSYTSTGSNLIMVAAVWRAGTTAASATPTYNSVSHTTCGNNVSSVSVNASLSPWYLINPATGSNTWACSNANDAEVVTFTGANQSGQPDSTASVNNEAAQVDTTLAVVTVNDNCMALAFYGNSTAVTPSAGTGCTLLDQELSSLFATICYNSTNPITPAGSYSMTISHSSCTGNYMAIVAVAPVHAAAASPSITSDIVFFN